MPQFQRIYKPKNATRIDALDKFKDSQKNPREACLSPKRLTSNSKSAVTKAMAFPYIVDNIYIKFNLIKLTHKGEIRQLTKRAQ